MIISTSTLNGVLDHVRTLQGLDSLWEVIAKDVRVSLRAPAGGPTETLQVLQNRNWHACITSLILFSKDSVCFGSCNDPIHLDMYSCRGLANLSIEAPVGSAHLRLCGQVPLRNLYIFARYLQVTVDECQESSFGNLLDSMTLWYQTGHQGMIASLECILKPKGFHRVKRDIPFEYPVDLTCARMLCALGPSGVPQIVLSHWQANRTGAPSISSAMEDVKAILYGDRCTG